MTITKQQVDELLEGLATRGEVIEEHEDGTKTFIFCPILIGDMLKKMQKKMQRYHAAEVSIFEQQVFNLLGAWEDCDTSASLQEIAGRIEWETCWCGELKDCVKKRASIVVAKPSPESRLLEFIYSLNLC